MSGSHRHNRRRVRRQNRALVVIATALGCWLGLRAPAVSPARTPQRSAAATSHAGAALTRAHGADRARAL